MHIILEKAKKYLTNDKTSQVDYYYSEKDGFWINKNSGEALVFEDGFSSLATKKCDIETGEDQKGE